MNTYSFNRKIELIHCISQITPLPCCIIKTIVENTLESEDTVLQDMELLSKAIDTLLNGLYNAVVIDMDEDLEDEIRIAIGINRVLTKNYIYRYRNRLTLPNLSKFYNYWRDTSQIRKNIKKWMSTCSSNMFFEWYAKEIVTFKSIEAPEYP